MAAAEPQPPPAPAEACHELCEFCASNVKHPLFCYMISDAQDSSGDAATYIGMSRQPYARLASHNREPGYRCGAKSTKSKAGRWHMALIVGPWSEDGCRQFKLDWRKSSRKFVSRLTRGCSQALAQRKHLCVFDPQWAQRLLKLQPPPPH